MITVRAVGGAYCLYAETNVDSARGGLTDKTVGNGLPLTVLKICRTREQTPNEQVIGRNCGLPTDRE